MSFKGRLAFSRGLAPHGSGLFFLPPLLVWSKRDCYAKMGGLVLTFGPANVIWMKLGSLANAAIGVFFTMQHRWSESLHCLLFFVPMQGALHRAR